LPILMALETGMRLGEVCGLKVGDIDLSKRTITVRNTKSNRDRIVFINDKLHRSLRVHLDNEFKGTIPIQAHKLLRLDYHETSKAFCKICRILGIKNATFHTLRHTFASYWVMSGKDIVVLPQKNGHLLKPHISDVHTGLEFCSLMLNVS
jgi:integrase/recombinase XerD